MSQVKQELEIGVDRWQDWIMPLPVQVLGKTHSFLVILTSCKQNKQNCQTWKLNFMPSSPENGWEIRLALLDFAHSRYGTQVWNVGGIFQVFLFIDKIIQDSCLWQFLKCWFIFFAGCGWLPRWYREIYLFNWISEPLPHSEKGKNSGSPLQFPGKCCSGRHTWNPGQQSCPERNC